MSDKFNELLAVLDMEKDEQFYDLHSRGLIDVDDCEVVISAITEEERDESIDKIFAYLAFQLRDEVVDKTSKFSEARMAIYRLVVVSGIILPDIWNEMEVWFISCAKPIHWIITALIAKELAKEKDNV